MNREIAAQIRNILHTIGLQMRALQVNWEEERDEILEELEKLEHGE